MAIKPGPGQLEKIKQGKESASEDPQIKQGKLAHNGLGELVKTVTEEIKKRRKNK